MTTMTPKSGVEITHYFHELVSHRQRKMILSMEAGQLDLWSRVLHSLIIILVLCFNDGIKLM